MRLIRAMAFAGLLSVVLAGCATTDGNQGSPVAGTNRPSVESVSPSESASPSTDATPAEDDSEPLKFGQTFTYEDGLSVTISAPRRFKPSEWAAADKAPAYVVFTVTIVNKTSKAFDPALFYATLQSANVEADQVFDSANGLEGSPSTKLLKGREVKFKIGFAVQNAKDLVMEVNPGMFEYENAIFTS